MTRHDRYLLRLWLARWGFALMVATAITVGLVAALTVSPPIEIPTIALEAAPVYRVEVGAAVFGGLYVASMALALSLHKRGFTEIGSGGFKAQDIAAASEGDLAGGVAMELLTELRDEVDDIQLQRQGNENAY
jgi:hypothetical protein